VAGGYEAFTPVRGIKESDILLLSVEEIAFDGHNRRVHDIKKVITP
jgi:hypothetical protein